MTEVLLVFERNNAGLKKLNFCLKRHKKVTHLPSYKVYSSVNSIFH
jgi:hypothetical protein